ncbi:hypothetical protein QE152_g36244 [Popillia japonica]|uniref:Uncharacterized protein n=1 Tax=Popillia japonica TaxID=7064 RepID=A0AAW1IDK6_POPJA
MSGVNTRSQKIKSVPKQKLGAPNTSYVTIVSDNTQEKNEESRLLTELRDKLAATKYTVKELMEQIDKKEQLLEYYKNKYENQLKISDNLQRTVCELTSRVGTTRAVDAQTQTTVVNLTPSHARIEKQASAKIRNQRLRPHSVNIENEDGSDQTERRHSWRMLVFQVRNVVTLLHGIPRMLVFQVRNVVTLLHGIPKMKYR